MVSSELRQSAWEAALSLGKAMPQLIVRGEDLLRRGKDLLLMRAIDLNAVRILPPVPKPSKILCVGLNYDDHLEESGLKKPDYPEIFARFGEPFFIDPGAPFFQSEDVRVHDGHLLAAAAQIFLSRLVIQTDHCSLSL